ncbi:hypothetical protein ARMSODRAFT_1065091 [Armillaria solidipes]|uniref:MYND-type domain-containing protein n=1 Tax=Armillaria solidipes TaxID=1076256 RepID=A0A2H3B5I5_9AGAR|nr:hypothetical protein ARMSODRAFT_1065091 [Armillaria solidipes]
MENLIRSAKDGSIEALMGLSLQSRNDQRARRAFFCVMEENLRFDTPSIQAMKRGRLPLIPSLNPKNVVNRSCSSLLALVTDLHNQSMSFQDNTPSLFALMSAVSFWLCLFFEYIILPSRAPEFKCIDFHHAVVHILSWTTKPNTLGIIEPRLLRNYLPFLWFHPPLGCPKYNLEDSRSIFAAVYIVILSPEWMDIFICRLEENSTVTANLIIQFIVDEFAHILEESDSGLIYQSFLTATTPVLQFSLHSPPVHTALLKNNSARWISCVLRFVTQCAQFTDVTLHLATDCVSKCLFYLRKVMEDGHSYIYQLLGYDVLLYLIKMFRNLHTHPELIKEVTKEAMNHVEDHTINILQLIASHFAYALILKRSQKAISKIQRDRIDLFLGLTDPGLKRVCETWNQFVTIAFYPSDIPRSITDPFCGHRQCPRMSAGKFMVCSGCQFTLYCSRICQKEDWSSGDHRSLCTKIRQLRNDGSPLPMSFSDRRAVESINSRYAEYYKQGSLKWIKLLNKYIVANGDPDPLWPLVLTLRYHALNVEPGVGIKSSRQCIKDPEIIAKA